VLNPAAVKDLAARKRLLVAECESHRRAFGLEVAQFQSSAAALARPVRSVLSVSRFLGLATPVAGLILGRRKTGSRSLMKMGLLGWQIFKRVQPFWARFRKRRDNRGG
jgi:hypothetical protein